MSSPSWLGAYELSDELSDELSEGDGELLGDVSVSIMLGVLDGDPEGVEGGDGEGDALGSSSSSSSSSLGSDGFDELEGLGELEGLVESDELIGLGVASLSALLCRLFAALLSSREWFDPLGEAWLACCRMKSCPLLPRENTCWDLPLFPAKIRGLGLTSRKSMPAMPRCLDE